MRLLHCANVVLSTSALGAERAAGAMANRSWVHVVYQLFLILLATTSLYLATRPSSPR